MSYMTALEAAGAKVLRYQYFGDYQGTILAEVEYEGKNGWVTIYYGSCSHCDAYEAFEEDFDWDIGPTDENLAEFGKRYLIDLRTTAQLIEQYTLDADWDWDAGEVLTWLKETV